MEKTMKILFVNKPSQDATTKDPQIFDGVTHYWIVRSELMKIGETLQEWLVRKQEYITAECASRNVEVPEGIFFYDMQPVGDIVGAPGKSSMIIRYQWIKKKTEEKTDMDSFNELLVKVVSANKVGIRRKCVILKRYMEALLKKKK